MESTPSYCLFPALVSPTVNILSNKVMFGKRQPLSTPFTSKIRYFISNEHCLIYIRICVEATKKATLIPRLKILKYSLTALIFTSTLIIWKSVMAKGSQCASRRTKSTHQYVFMPFKNNSGRGCLSCSGIFSSGQTVCDLKSSIVCGSLLRQWCVSLTLFSLSIKYINQSLKKIRVIWYCCSF